MSSFHVLILGARRSLNDRYLDMDDCMRALHRSQGVLASLRVGA